MLLYLLIRTLKYRIAVTAAEIRTFWYLFYVPMIMMPTLFLMTCVRFHAGRDSKPRELVLLIPVALLAGAVLTNDLHFLVFIPQIDLAALRGDVGTYTYGALYWLVYVWIGLCFALGVFFLLWKAHGFSEWQRGLWPILFLAAIPALTALKCLFSGRLCILIPYYIVISPKKS